MKVGIIGEGDTEFACVPTLVSKKGHLVVGTHNLGGIGEDFPWDKLFSRRVYPYVRSFAVKDISRRPDKVIVIIDREGRSECCGGLADIGQQIITEELRRENLAIDVSVVIPNREIECWLLADTRALDTSPLFARPLSPLLGDQTDEKNIMGLIKSNLRKGKGWDKVSYGKSLAQKLSFSDEVLSRSRSLRKFVKELDE